MKDLDRERTRPGASSEESAAGTRDQTGPTVSPPQELDPGRFLPTTASAAPVGSSRQKPNEPRGGRAPCRESRPSSGSRRPAAPHGESAEMPSLKDFLQQPRAGKLKAEKAKVTKEPSPEFGRKQKQVLYVGESAPACQKRPPPVKALGLLGSPRRRPVARKAARRPLPAPLTCSPLGTVQAGPYL